MQGHVHSPEAGKSGHTTGTAEHRQGQRNYLGHGTLKPQPSKASEPAAGPQGEARGGLVPTLHKLGLQTQGQTAAN